MFSFKLFSKNKSFFVFFSLSVKALYSLSCFCVPLGDVVLHFHLARGHAILWACLWAFLLDSSSYHCGSPGRRLWRVRIFSVRLVSSLGSQPMVLCGLGDPQSHLGFWRFLPTPGGCLRRWALGSHAGIHHHLRWRLVTSSLTSPSQKVDWIFFLLKN